MRSSAKRGYVMTTFITFSVLLAALIVKPISSCVHPGYVTTTFTTFSVLLAVLLAELMRSSVNPGYLYITTTFITFSILLAALIIEPVGDLMTDHHADAAVVHVPGPVSLSHMQFLN